VEFCGRRPAHPVSLVTKKPFFSVIIATYRRGEHIRPTILSALEQSFGDFEVIVVADGCDETANAVETFASSKISTYRLPINSGSQSAPNNFGIARAKGRYVAYLGHDDVWRPEHLASLAEVFERCPSPQVVASGCVYHGPAGSGIYFVTGLLDDEHGAADHFLPPSALAHTRELFDAVGPWPEPHTVSPPVDDEFVLRAVRAGATFASTGKVTVHKFAAGHRYLSYLQPASLEQTAILSTLRDHASASDSNDLLDAAKNQGRYMAMKHHDVEAFGKGYLFERNRSNKGLRTPPLRPLDGKEIIAQTEEPRGLDWHELEHSERPYRWSGPSPKPRVLIPFKGDGPARLKLKVMPGTPPDVLAAVSFDQEGRTVPHVFIGSPSADSVVELEVQLRPDDCSVLGITTPQMFRPSERMQSSDTRLLGIALSDIEVAPL